VSSEHVPARVAVVGAGAMGAGIAYVCAGTGHAVTLTDASPAALDAGLERVRSYAADGVRRGRLDPAAASDLLARVQGAETAERAVAGADAVIEAVVEDLDVKRDLFARIEALVASETLLASNTSALPIGAVMGSLQRPGRAIGMHFFNPVPAMRLCEIVVGARTETETVTRAVGLAQGLGKETVVVRDVPGFATSRLNAVIGNEAFRMLEDGVATAEDIDTAAKLGLNHPMGPFEMIDLVGLDVRLAVMNALEREFGDAYRPSDLHRRLVRDGRLGRKSGRGIYEYDHAGRRGGTDLSA
jgi:3-hydroxybutyryl-CoA dehydrogenase